MKSLLKGKLGKAPLLLFLVTIFVVAPLISIGAIWVQHVGLLPGTAVVFPSDAAAMDRFMAAALKPYYGDRVGICDGTNDHLEIQAALDAVYEVRLSEGTFNCEATINLDSDQTLRGCGWNTILTTSTDELVFLSAVGGNGTEKTGIVISDLQIDGGPGLIGDIGVYFYYVDYSLIENIYTRRYHSGLWWCGIAIFWADYNTIKNNKFEECDGGFLQDDSSHTTITGNIFIGNGGAIYCGYGGHNIITENICQQSSKYAAIQSQNGNYNIILGNFCQGNSHEGISVAAVSHTIVAENTCILNGRHGIILTGIAENNTIIANVCTENSQTTDNTYDDIYLYNTNYNTIQGNVCRAGAQANKPRYGIHVSHSSCNKNLVIGNDIYNDGFGTASFYDVGTLTHVEDNNRGISLDQIRHFRTVKNTSGVQRVAGDVVSLKAVANGYEITAPAAVGERQVFGMVAETIANNGFGLVQTKGKTTVLKSTNAGGGNIVIGDFLITENGVRARKAAAATDPIFARALEACAAANCVIDAYINSPWD